MELRHLRYFVAVASGENVTRAAALLHVSQPALSRQIRDLEEELGVRLFERSAQSLRLTSAGTVFLEESKAVLERAGAAVRKVRESDGKPQGELHVGYAPSPTVEILATALNAFEVSLPGTQVILHDMTTREMLTGLEDNKLDAALLVKPDCPSGKGFKFETLREYRVGVLVSARHPFTTKRSVAPSDLEGEKLVVYSPADYPDYHRWITRLLGRGRKSIVAECDGALSLIAAVQSGRGLAVVPESIVSMAGGRAKFVPFSPAPKPLVVGLAYRGASKNLLQFMDVVRRSVV